MLDLKKIRLLRGYTQETLADKVGIKRGTILKIENRQSYPSVSNAMAIADVLGISNWYDIYTPELAAAQWKGTPPTI